VVLLGAPAALALSRFAERPQLAWLALALVGAVVVTDALRPATRTPSP
jgi:hypothetical protein